MKKLFSKLFATSNLSQSGYPAISDTLAILLGTKVWQRIVLRTPDRRQLLEEAAAEKGIGEEDLIRMIAEKLSMPIFFRPKAADIRLLPEGLLLPDLRRAGVLPLTAQGMITGVVCVDPASLNLMPRLYSGSNIYLGSWNSILAALDESEKIYRERKAEVERQKREAQVVVFRKVLGRLADQALDQGADKVTLLADLDSLSYGFKARDGQHWGGQIDSKVALKLARFLEDCIAEAKQSIEALGRQDKAIDLDLTVEHGRILLNLNSPK